MLIYGVMVGLFAEVFVLQILHLIYRAFVVSEATVYVGFVFACLLGAVRS